MCHYASNLRRPASDLSTAASCRCDQADTGTAINAPPRQQLRQSTWNVSSSRRAATAARGLSA